MIYDDSMFPMLRSIEQELSSLKRTADAMRVSVASSVLQGAFPELTTAVFARDWDQDSVRLRGLTSSYPTLEVEARYATMPTYTRTQLDAMRFADLLIKRIGDDEEVGSVLTYIEAEEGTETFLLELLPSESPAEPAQQSTEENV